MFVRLFVKCNCESQIGVYKFILSSKGYVWQFYIMTARKDGGKSEKTEVMLLKKRQAPEIRVCYLTHVAKTLKCKSSLDMCAYR